jgi:YggT family protein
VANFVYFIIDALLGLLSFVIIVWAIMSWLIAFNVINERNDFVRMLLRFLDAVVRPVLWPLQRVIPNLGGVDITPVIALLIIQGARMYLLPMIFRPLIPVLG